MKPFRYIALVGNIIYIFWIVWNGIDEGSRSVGRLEVVSLIGLLILLALNAVLLLRSK